VALRLRAARAADFDALVALHVASWRDAYREVLDPAFLAGPIEAALAEQWRAALAARRRPGEVIVATAGRELAGFVAAWRDGTVCHIENLHVRPGLRNAGIGRALLGFAAKRLAQQGCEAATLWVFARNTGAIHFYRSLGADIGPEEWRETFGQRVAERSASWPAIATLVAACARPRER
jgi:ribosomal protein S18 acetylase RimI-like enzyme